MMAENVFDNLPRRKRRALDEFDRGFREALAMYEPEGPLPARPRPSGKGGPSIGQTPTPPVVTSVWSAADATANGMTLSNGGLTIAYPGAANWVSARGTVSKSSGKVYVEFMYGGGQASVSYTAIGLANAGFDATQNIGATNYSGGFQLPDFQTISAGFALASQNLNLSVTTIGDVVGMAVDFTAQKIWFSYNNVWSTSLTRPAPEPTDPGSGTFNNLTFVAATVGALFPAISFHGSGGVGGGVWTLQPTAASQKYAPPAGFSAWG